jgi:hypothetical protein
MLPNKNFERELQIKAYFVFGVAMYICFYHLISNSMLAQMQQPPFIFEQTELVYKWYLASSIPQFVTSHTIVSSIFDISLLVFTVGFLLSKRRIFAVLFSLTAFNYFMTYNLVTGHHYHGFVGVLVISIPFWFKSEQRFNFSWEAVRYYLLYIFSSAALWKILRGSAFYHDQLSNILKAQQIDLLLQNPDSFKAHIAQYLIANSGVSHLLLIVNIILQLIFILGFFTKKFDMLLFALSVIFVIANYYVMGIMSFELLILNLTLLDWEKIEAYLIKKEIVTVE